MATQKAYRLVVTLEAGTQKFFTDMKAAGVTIKEFERAGASMGHGAVSSMQASSAAARELGGAIPIRAAERFLAVTLGLGPALAKAFPLFGLVAMGGMLTEM